jgi:DNA-binding NtrC family response regulator
MKTKHEFKIVVLEDSDFYNNLLTHQLKNYTDAIAQDKGYSFDIESYRNSNDCLRNIKPETDIAFVDYYLGEGINGIDVLKKIKEKCKDCKIIIMSQVTTLKTSIQTVNYGASDFIIKDRFALNRSCYIVEEIINERIQSGV